MRTSLPAFARLRLAQTNNRTKKRYRSGVAFFAPSPYGMRCRSFGSPARRAVLRGQRQRDSSLWTPFLAYAAGGPCAGQRSYADSARGTRPSGLPSIACGRDGYARSSVLLRPAKRTAGRRGGCGKSLRM